MGDLFSQILASFGELWSQAVDIWLDGGWAMIAIAVIAFVMFSVGFTAYMKLRRKGFMSTPERVWRRWIDHPLERRGKIGIRVCEISSNSDRVHNGKHARLFVVLSLCRLNIGEQPPHFWMSLGIGLRLNSSHQRINVAGNDHLRFINTFGPLADRKVLGEKESSIIRTQLPSV